MPMKPLRICRSNQSRGLGAKHKTIFRLAVKVLIFQVQYDPREAVIDLKWKNLRTWQTATTRESWPMLHYNSADERVCKRYDFSFAFLIPLYHYCSLGTWYKLCIEMNVNWCTIATLRKWKFLTARCDTCHELAHLVCRFHIASGNVIPSFSVLSTNIVLFILVRYIVLHSYRHFGFGNAIDNISLVFDQNNDTNASE